MPDNKQYCSPHVVKTFFFFHFTCLQLRRNDSSWSELRQNNAKGDTAETCRKLRHPNGRGKLLTMLNNFHQVSQVWQNGTTHQNSYLLNDFDSCMPCLPWLLTAANSLQEWQQGRNTKGRSNHSEGSAWNNAKVSTCRNVIIFTIQCNSLVSSHSFHMISW